MNFEFLLILLSFLLHFRYCIQRNGSEKCDTYQTYVNGKCLDLAIPGENCTDNLQCIAASICVEGKFFGEKF